MREINTLTILSLISPAYYHFNLHTNMDKFMFYDDNI